MTHMKNRRFRKTLWQAIVEDLDASFRGLVYGVVLILGAVLMATMGLASAFLGTLLALSG